MIKYSAGMVLLFFLLWGATLPASAEQAPPAPGDDGGTSFDMKEDGVKKGNIFDIIFGSAPLMPTQNGILIIDSYFDENNNQQWDEGEKPLEKAVLCVLDEVEYAVPAFIPGLANGSNYSLTFSGDKYVPLIKKKDVFIKRRGEIIKIDVPCIVTPAPPSEPQAPAQAG